MLFNNKKYVNMPRDLSPLFQPFVTTSGFLVQVMLKIAKHADHKLYPIRRGENGIYHRASLRDAQYINYIIEKNEYTV